MAYIYNLYLDICGCVLCVAAATSVVGPSQPAVDEIEDVLGKGREKMKKGKSPN